MTRPEFNPARPLALAALLLLTLVATARAAPVLVDAEWLEPRLNDPSIVLIDMSSDPTQYQRFHLPGAVYLPFGALVQRTKEGVSLRLDDAKLVALLGQVSIAADKHVVIYDDMGGLNAGRLFWDLERIGHPEVSVLDGGLVDWILSGRKVTAAPVMPKPVAYIRPATGGRANVISHADFRAAVAAGKATVLDVRSQPEYVGNPREPRSGHVPGARFWPWDATVAFDDSFKLKPVPSLVESLQKSGVTDPTALVITYCRSGHRAAQAYLTLRSLGHSDVRVYDGSMLEYERDSSAPLKKGMEP